MMEGIIKGELFSVKIEKYPDELIQIFSDDDGFSHEHGSSFSSYWIDDLMDVLQRVKKTSRHQQYC